MIYVIDFNLINCEECLDNYSSTKCSCLRDNPDKCRVLSQFYTSLVTYGVTQIINYQIDKKVLNQVQDVSYQFFNETLEYKLARCSKDKARRGYSSVCSENFSSLIGKYNQPNDSVEKYRIGPLISDELKKMKSNCGSSSRTNEQNKFDSSGNNNVPSFDNYYNSKEGKIHFYENNMNFISNKFNDFVSRYYTEMNNLSIILMKLIVYCCRLSYRHLFYCLLDKPTSILSLNYYPKLQLPPQSQVGQTLIDNDYNPSTSTTTATATNYKTNQSAIVSEQQYEKLIRISEHTDVSLFTIVYQTSDGLEVYDSSTNQYMPIIYKEGALIVNVGDCLQYWSDGLFKSCKHRVVETSTSSSSSAAAESTSPHWIQKHFVESSVTYPSVTVNSLIDDYSRDSHHEGVNQHCHTVEDESNNANKCVPSSGDSKQNRLSMAFFYTPNYDIHLDWPPREERRCLTNHNRTRGELNDYNNSSSSCKCSAEKVENSCCEDAGCSSKVMMMMKDLHHVDNDDNDDDELRALNGGNESEGKREGTKLTYSQWRKHHIKKAIQNLK